MATTSVTPTGSDSNFEDVLGQLDTVDLGVIAALVMELATCQGVPISDEERRDLADNIRAAAESDACRFFASYTASKAKL